MTFGSERTPTVDLRSSKKLAEDLPPARRRTYYGALGVAGAAALVGLGAGVLLSVVPRSLPFELTRIGPYWVVCEVTDASLGLRDGDIVVSIHGHAPRHGSPTGKIRGDSSSLCAA